MKKCVLFSNAGRLLALFTLFFCVTFIAKADEVSVECSAPSSVILGRNFQVTYSINSSADNISVPDIDDFTVLMGPSTMTSSSYSFVNGKPQSSRQTSFTYVLRATKVGTFSIPAAKVSANGKSYTSNSVKVTVVQGEASSSGSQQSGAGSGSASRSSASSSSSEDLFIRQSLSRTSVYEGEATELVTKVYARVSLQSLSDVVAPKLSDFVVNDLGDNNITFKTEYIDGKEYQVGELSRKSIIPQRSGRITIEPTEAEFVVKRNVRRNTGSIFDDFFGDVQMTKQRVKTSSLTLNVKPLPDGKPTGFSGGVGQFKFNVEVSPTETKVDNSVQVRVSVEGTGNLKLLSMPKPQFHQDFDTFDPSSKGNVDGNARGFTGKRTDEYLVIPRRDGKFEIPQIQFSYFDPQQGKYVKQTQGPFEINVAKSEGSANGQGSGVSFPGSGPEKVTYTGSDLRYLHKSDDLSGKYDFFLFSFLFWLLFLLPIAALMALTIVYRKRMFDNANVSLVKSRKANKMARRRLKQAAKYIKVDKREAFFDEVMRALWGYLSDKLSLPLSELTKDNARDKMASHDVDSDVADDFMTLLEECEFARYAPASVTSTMQEVYDKAADVIERIEGNKKK